MKHRVVITGMGIWSCIGQDLETVTESLRLGRSGIIFDQSRIDYGLQSGLVGNVPRPDLKPLLPRKFRATMSEDAEYAYMAARQAFLQAEITDEYLRENEVGIIWGSDGNSQQVEQVKEMHEFHDTQVLDPNTLFRSLTSSASMNLSTIFCLRGINLSVASACASGGHAIAVGAMYLKAGMQKQILIGASYSPDKYGAIPRDAHRMLSSDNGHPQTASKPFDKNRTGDIQSGGAAAIVLEEYENAIKRGADIIAEVVGLGFSNMAITDTNEINDESYYQCIVNTIKNAHVSATDIDYVSSIAAGTKEETYEFKALSRIFTNNHTYIGSQQCQVGHEYWMTGASKVVYSLLMMQNNFVSPQINLDMVDDNAKYLNITKTLKYTPLNTILVHTSGLRGTHCALIFKKCE